jgi:hypothetical protein
MVTSIGQLRALAKMNLCDRCFTTYTEIIEPTVKNYLFSPLEEWRRAESSIFQITMRLAGAYKTQVSVYNIDENKFDNVAHLVDKDKYLEIKCWSFKRRIDYLHKQGFLGDASHLFFDEARKVRNKIHADFTESSEKDLDMLSVAGGLASQFLFAVVPPTKDDISAAIKSRAETLAKNLLTYYGITKPEPK